MVCKNIFDGKSYRTDWTFARAGLRQVWEEVGKENVILKGFFGGEIKFLFGTKFAEILQLVDCARFFRLSQHNGKSGSCRN